METVYRDLNLIAIDAGISMLFVRLPDCERTACSHCGNASRTSFVFHPTMSEPLETITATREQLESAVKEHAELHAQVLARDAVEHHERVFLERESELRQQADQVVDALRAEHAQEKQLMSDKLGALEMENAKLRTACTTTQLHGAQLEQRAQRMQEQLEYANSSY